VVPTAAMTPRADRGPQQSAFTNLPSGPADLDRDHRIANCLPKGDARLEVGGHQTNVSLTSARNPIRNRVQPLEIIFRENQFRDLHEVAQLMFVSRTCDRSNNTRTAHQPS